ncbi:glycosyltransferase [Tieghemostelium lacteum]|uniref:Fucosyltransferase n=1 Tax=Tieghemostelium lacteum TaxID=361077 RepID=A0A151ZKK2_TIELA|nr:glycosyltransferase [Tieghemostelium lacteum]|eukprot:KYQ94476.1 glycosyltransferase [Tieghemostelium lacteum]
MKFVLLLILGIIIIQFVNGVQILVLHGGATWSGLGVNPYTTPNYLGQTVHKEKCSVECEYTSDKTLFDSSDAVMIEAQAFANFGYAYLKQKPELPQKQVNQYYINFGYEHDGYFPIFSEPGFHNHIDVNATFQQNYSAVPVTFACNWGSYDKGGIEEFKTTPIIPTAHKIQHIGFMASNCHGGGAIYRTSYLKDMMKQIRIDAMGMCLHNFDLAPEDNEHHLFDDLGDSFRIKRKVLGKYMFSISFENNNKTDYVTEKVFTSLLSGSVPIYMGADNIDEWVPKGSIIKTSDFKSPTDLVNHLKYLISNHTAYEEYFQWKTEPFPEKFIEKHNKCLFYNGDCRICEYIHKRVTEYNNSAPAGHRLLFGEPENVKGQKRLIILPQDTSCLIILQNDTIPAISGYFTILMWLEPIELEFDSKLLSIGDDQVIISIHSEWSRDYIRYCWGTSGEQCFLSEIPIIPGQWKHIGIVAQPGDIPGTEVITFYTNGNFDSSYKTVAKPDIASTGVKLGCDTHGYRGKVDDLTIFNHALTQKEVNQAMFKKFRGDEPGLLHYLTFNDWEPIDYSKYRSKVEYRDIITSDTGNQKLDLNCC